MKLSIEINEQAKKLLLELLDDGDIQNRILDIAGNPDIDIDDAIDAKTSDFLVAEDCDEQIRDFLKNSTFTTNFED